MSYHQLLRSLLDQELILVSSIRKLNGVNRSSKVFVVVERQDELARIGTAAKLLRYLLLYLPALLLTRYSVVEINQHRRSKSVLDVVDVVVSNLLLKLCNKVGRLDSLLVSSSKILLGRA
jgi:hypothetical protein